MRQAEQLQRPADRIASSIQRTSQNDLELNLSRAVGTKVRVSGEKKGKIELYFSSTDELERLLELLNYQP